MASTEFQCELSWSASRAREFERCRRENWFARYGSWGWWKEKPPGKRYEIMVHKNLTSLAAFAGDCVHRALERWFELRRGGTRMTAAELFEEARELFRAGWRDSQGGGWKERPNRRNHLEEHHYGMEIPRERTESYRVLMERCARNFIELPALESVRNSAPEQWLAVEAMDTYQFLGTRVYAIPDFALQEGERIHIYDWKTGRPREEDRFQLHTYALYACEKWAADPESIELHAVYLGTGKVETLTVDPYYLSEVQDRMSESVRAMMEVHYDPDRDEAVMEHWGPTGAPEACPHCRFRGLCDAAPVSGAAGPLASA